MAKKLTQISLLLLGAFVIVNIFGVFMPELGFDALWYHLTLSKLFLLQHRWYFPGGLFYYSAMPRLAELIGLPLLAVFGSIGPKLIQFVSGIICCFLIFGISFRFTKDKLLSLVAVILFYATWLVSWQSSSAYVDLVRTAFELAALFILTKEGKLTTRKIILSGVFIGLAIGVKWQSLGSLFLAAIIFTPLLVPIALLTALPWFLIAYHFTGNPVYPLFEKFMSVTQLAQVSPHYYNFFSILLRFILAPVFLTKPTEDFLSPVAGLVYIVAFLGLLSSQKNIRKFAIYGILGTFLLFLTPPPSTRYFMPYFPALILAAIYVISRLKTAIIHWIIIVILVSALAVLSLRLYSLAKFVPYLSGHLTLNQFLASQSYRLPGTFIDSDNYISDHLPANSSYLISNLHNLYYFPYNFDHDSFINSSKHYDYLITKDIPASTLQGQLIHTNSLGIQIFKL